MLDRTLGRARLLLVAGTTLAVAVGGVRVVAQDTPSLAELARKEQERRKGQKTPAKVYTKKDLPPSPQGAAGQTAGAKAAPAPSSQERRAPENKDGKDDKDDKAEAAWRTRIAEAREELRRSEMFAEALQTRINALGTDFVSRDDPYQRGRIGQDRDKALAELARVKSEIVRGQQKIEDIEEEARKAGVPPGWLR